ncbi:MAG TPA: hypothetical protein VFY54_16710 [Rubrobacter sp.]|nr:hypothetical protein [Rubrobacter sp.]
MTTKLWSMTDLARDTGSSRQTVWWRVQHGRIPAPGYYSRDGIPYWSERVGRRIVAEWVPDLRKER